MPRVNVYVPEELDQKVKMYNAANPYCELNVSKITQDALKQTLKSLGYP